VTARADVFAFRISASDIFAFAIFAFDESAADSFDVAVAVSFVLLSVLLGPQARIIERPNTRTAVRKSTESFTLISFPPKILSQVIPGRAPERFTGAILFGRPI
jgi:hypothetical protein